VQSVRFLIVVAFWLAGAVPAWQQKPALPQQPVQEEQPNLVIRTETNLALVRFHLAQQGRFSDRLRPEDIQLLEDGKPQKLALFEGPRTGHKTPVEILLLFDVSLSVMNNDLLNPFTIKETLVDGLGNHVSVAVYAFGGKWKRFTTPTRDFPTLRKAVEEAFDFTNAGTPLYESIIRTARDAVESGSNATRLMVIFSDGFATTKMPPQEAAKAALSYDIPLYPVVLGHQRVVQQAMGGGGGGPFGAAAPNPNAIHRQMIAHDKEQQMLEFAELGEMTGGRSFDPPVVNPVIVREVLQWVATQVQFQYVAGYYVPPSSQDKRPHKVEVKLLDKKLGKLRGGSRAVIH
jgi:VWFA-related protein